MPYNETAMTESESQLAAKPKRRWYQYSLRTLLLLPLLLALALSAVCSWPIVQRHYALWRLQGYVDKDLRRLPEEERQQVDYWIETLIGWHKVLCSLGHESWLVHAANDRDGSRMLYVVAMEPALAVPGSSCFFVHALDSSGLLLRSTRCDLGKRNRPDIAAWDEIQHGLLCLTMETKGVRGNYEKRFYRIEDGYVALLRSETQSRT